jgi:hypothetical protein
MHLVCTIWLYLKRLKPEIHLNDISKFSSYCAGKYSIYIKNNAVQENNHLQHCGKDVKFFFMLKQVVRVVSSVL